MGEFSPYRPDWDQESTKSEQYRYSDQANRPDWDPRSPYQVEQENNEKLKENLLSKVELISNLAGEEYSQFTKEIKERSVEISSLTDEIAQYVTLRTDGDITLNAQKMRERVGRGEKAGAIEGTVDAIKFWLEFLDRTILYLKKEISELSLVHTSNISQHSTQESRTKEISQKRKIVSVLRPKIADRFRDQNMNLSNGQVPNQIITFPTSIPDIFISFELTSNDPYYAKDTNWLANYIGAAENHEMFSSPSYRISYRNDSPSR